jgi:hypothetical protein
VDADDGSAILRRRMMSSPLSPQKEVRILLDANILFSAAQSHSRMLAEQLHLV